MSAKEGDEVTLTLRVKLKTLPSKPADYTRLLDPLWWTRALFGFARYRDPKPVVLEVKAKQADRTVLSGSPDESAPKGDGSPGER